MPPRAVSDHCINRSLNHYELRAGAAWRRPGSRSTLRVGRILARGDLVEGAPFRFHPYVGIAGKHGARDVPGDAHDHLVASSRIVEFRCQGAALGLQPALLVRCAIVRIMSRIGTSTPRPGTQVTFPDGTIV